MSQEVNVYECHNYSSGASGIGRFSRSLSNNQLGKLDCGGGVGVACECVCGKDRGECVYLGLGWVCGDLVGWV
jgi:hypothetical protein